MKTAFIILAVTLAALPLSAQLVNDGATKTLSNVTNAITGDVIVGTNGSFTLLVLSNNTLLSNSGNGIIGLNSTARSNEVQLLTASARWLVGSSLVVGSNGASSRLVVSNGALVSSVQGIIGEGPAGSNNIAVVTGLGSSWSVQNNLELGNAGNRMVISNGGRVVNINGRLGSVAGGNNDVLVVGAGSVWSNRGGLFVGILGAASRLVISNGAQVVTASISYLSGSIASTSNEVSVTGSGSLWSIGSSLDVGNVAGGNRMVISDGGRVANGTGRLGSGAGSSGNVAIVAGSGSVWSNASDLSVGDSSPGNRLMVSNSAVVMASNAVYLGFNFAASDNRIEINGGSLLVTNAFGTGLFDLRRGTNVLEAGWMEVDQLLMTNTAAFFQFNGGTVSARNSRVSNGTLFRVGNGTNSSTFMLAGNGMHDFTGALAVSVSSNAVLTGNGTLVGGLTVLSGGKLVPGASIGRIILSNAPSLQGTVVMELSKNGAVLTNDQVQVAGTLTYGGALTVNDLGPATLASGDNFKLFNATAYGGSFTSISLPPLNSGLGWTNKLLVDGSIAVVGVPQPAFTSIALSGTNVVISGTNGPPNAPYALLSATNIATPFSNWTSIATNQFDSNGNFSITNAIVPGEPQRYFRIRTP